MEIKIRSTLSPTLSVCRVRSLSAAGRCARSELKRFKRGVDPVKARRRHAPAAEMAATLSGKRSVLSQSAVRLAATKNPTPMANEASTRKLLWCATNLRRVAPESIKQLRDKKLRIMPSAKIGSFSILPHRTKRNIRSGSKLA